MIELTAYPIPSPQVVDRQLEGEAVVVMPEQGRVKVLNEVGARIWGLMDGNRNVADIIAVLVDEYAGDPDTIEQDVLDFLNQLVEAGGLTISSKPELTPPKTPK